MLIAYRLSNNKRRTASQKPTANSQRLKFSYDHCSEFRKQPTAQTLKVSIITVTYNSSATVADTLKSVASQDHEDIEHIIVDGASIDSTMDIVRGYPHVGQVISEPDKGMYDALNKGIAKATGDIIGILNSDDAFHNEQVISKITEVFKTNDVDAIFGDIRFISPTNRSKTIRYYSSAQFHPGKFEWGYMPAHPSFYCKKSIYEKYGDFQINYQIAADYEWLTRVLYKYKVTYKYLPLLTVDMLPGGLSNGTLKSRWVLNKEIIRACAENGIKTNMWKLSIKYFSKVFEYLKRN